MSVPTSATAYIPLITAAIAAGAAYLASIFSKELKTSEFRQAWIDALRSDISEVVAVSLQITDEIKVMSKHGETVSAIQAHLKTRTADIQRLEMYKARIQLRLNPNEHQKLLGLIEQMTEFARIETVSKELIAESQRVLKAEWNRVKRGEPIFFAVKRASLVVFVVALVGVAYYLI